MSTVSRKEPALEHHHADLGDVRLHYVEAGSGPLVVLLHGFPEFWYSWRPAFGWWHQICAATTSRISRPKWGTTASSFSGAT
jgi:pimeloyl-ACP methyl ester carboxylesterase